MIRFVAKIAKRTEHSEFKWYVDSGASAHMRNNESTFFLSKQISRINLSQL